MSNLNLKGLWIPIEVLTDKNLSDKEKHIYSLIIFLSQEKKKGLSSKVWTFYFQYFYYFTQIGNYF